MIAEIKERLAEAGTPFALVAGATALAQIKDRPLSMPAAYVLPLEEESDPSARMGGPLLQRTRAQIGVVLVLENLGDPDGDAVTDELERVKTWARRQLVGFEPAECEALQHVAGEILQARGGCVWWQHVFETAYFEQEGETP